jgi:beta-glucosidase
MAWPIPTAILACAKHFVGYSETQGGRDASEADLTPRKLRAWFLPPFERAARAGCRTFMLGYQSIDGTPITANEWLLNDVLKREWGFSGTLVTDWDNVGRMVWEQKIQPDHASAAAVAVKAGNDLVMTTPAFFEGAQEAAAPRPAHRGGSRPGGGAHPAIEVRAGPLREPTPARPRRRRRP